MERFDDFRVKEILEGLMTGAEMEISGDEVIIMLKVPKNELVVANRVLQQMLPPGSDLAF